MVRSDWSTRWPDPGLALLTRFPGVSLAALQFLHLQRHILFHGHEPLDTDSTPTLEGESWLMHNGFAQAEGVANLDEGAADRVPDRDGLPEVRGRARRLRTLHRDLPEDVALRRQRRRAAGGAVAAVRAPPALGSRARDARSLTSPAGRTGRSPVRPAPLGDLPSGHASASRRNAAPRKGVGGGGGGVGGGAPGPLGGSGGSWVAAATLARRA